MKRPYSEGLESHIDPESWECISNGVFQALTGVGTGWVLSLENNDYSRGPTCYGHVKGNSMDTVSARRPVRSCVFALANAIIKKEVLLGQ